MLPKILNEMAPTLFDRGSMLTWKQKVCFLAWKFKGPDEVPCPVQHRFEGDLYIREMKIPANTLFIGRAHRHGHLCQLLSGSILMISEDAQIELHAPSEVRTDPGYHMVLYTLSDIVGRTVHPSHGGRDLDILEADAFESVDSMLDLAVQVERIITPQIEAA